MGAVRERVMICPEQDGQPVAVLDFPLWWDRHEFFEKYGDRRLDTGSPHSVDYGLLMTGWEAAAWDRQCREKFATDPRSSDAFYRASMSQWETALKTARWVIVESNEWESGLS